LYIDTINKKMGMNTGSDNQAYDDCDEEEQFEQDSDRHVTII